MTSIATKSYPDDKHSIIISEHIKSMKQLTPKVVELDLEYEGVVKIYDTIEKFDACMKHAERSREEDRQRIADIMSDA